MKRWYFPLLLFSGILFASCEQDNAGMVGTVQGYKPIYSTDPNLYKIESKPMQTVVKAGKIYVKGNYIFQNEVGQGIHIYDNSNPANAKRIGFIKILGSEELSIKGNFLYSNNLNDLVVIDISNISAVTEVKRLKNAFHTAISLQVPPVSGSYFECVDQSKGVITGWAKETLNNPKCRN